MYLGFNIYNLSLKCAFECEVKIKFIKKGEVKWLSLINI
jgi:hypothetical protein